MRIPINQYRLELEEQYILKFPQEAKWIRDTGEMLHSQEFIHWSKVYNHIRDTQIIDIEVFNYDEVGEVELLLASAVAFCKGGGQEMLKVQDLLESTYE